MSGDLPEDPFEPDVPDFEDFTGPHADEIKRLIRKYASSKDDFLALHGQQSLRELGTAVWALDEERARAALLRAMAASIAHYMKPEQFRAWVEAQ